MPSTIPYDPSLTLMSVVNDKALKNIEAIAKAQGPVDAAKDALNSMISSKRSLVMTKTELRNLGVATDNLDVEIDKLNKAVEASASEYAKAKMAAEPQILKLKGDMRAVHRQIESPVDYMYSQIKTLPLAADTMNMDVQYFSFDSNSQDSATYSTQIASYISSTMQMFGTKRSLEAGAAASRQVSRQVGTHSIEGTLVLSVSCTHKNASVIAPFVLNTDKAIKVWNHLFPNEKLDPTNKASMMKVCTSDDSKEDASKFSIISGTTFGSSFVGMVHVLNTSSTSASETMTAAASSLKATMDVAGFFNKASGKLGVDSKFAGDVKNLLSQQNIQSHVTLLTMGVIPSMVASEVSLAVEKFAKFDPAASMEQVAAIQNATASDQATVKQMAEASRTGGQASEVEAKKIEATMSALATIDDGKNKILDVNSMMTAFDDYLKKAAEGNCGVPINYYLKDIDMKSLAQMWVAKYYPGEYMSIKIDDSEGAGPAGGTQEKAKL